MIKEHDVVTLATDKSSFGLKKGDKGTVVHCYSIRHAYVVEFPNNKPKPKKPEYEYEDGYGYVVKQPEPIIVSLVDMEIVESGYVEPAPMPRGIHLGKKESA